MAQKLTKTVFPTLAATSLFLVSCDDDDKQKKGDSDLLIGEWDVVSIDGNSVGEGVYDSQGYAYGIAFEFQADGDFGFCQSYFYRDNPSENYSSCYDGEWEFVNADLLEITLSYDGGSTEWEFAIESITSDRIEGDLLIENGSYDYELILEKQ